MEGKGIYIFCVIESALLEEKKNLFSICILLFCSRLPEKLQSGGKKRKSTTKSPTGAHEYFY